MREPEKNPTNVNGYIDNEEPAILEIDEEELDIEMLWEYDDIAIRFWLGSGREDFDE